MSLFFNEINVYGLQKISLKRKELTYKEIKDLLTFEDVDEVKTNNANTGDFIHIYVIMLAVSLGGLIIVRKRVNA